MKKINAELITINTVNPSGAVKTLEYCNKLFRFEKITLFTDTKIKGENFDVININPFKNLDEYSDFCLTLTNYIKSDYVILVHEDGHFVNGNLWSDDFYSYDYIGAPWPDDENWFNTASGFDKNKANFIKSCIKKNRIGNGGFCLRSKKFLDYSKQFSTCNNIPEDFFLCSYNYDLAMESKIKFPSVNVAMKFSYENALQFPFYKKWVQGKTFNQNKHLGWHGWNFKNSNNLMKLKDKI